MSRNSSACRWPPPDQRKHAADNAVSADAEKVPAGVQAATQGAPAAPRPAPTQVQFDDDDLDVPDFLK